jgi:uncharacterized membrane protein YgaE (UPF0421/DUF939 family)
MKNQRTIHTGYRAALGAALGMLFALMIFGLMGSFAGVVIGFFAGMIYDENRRKE